MLEQNFVYMCASVCMCDNSLRILHCIKPSISFLWLSLLVFRIQFVRLIVRPENTILKWFSNLLTFQEKYIFLPYIFFKTFLSNSRDWTESDQDRKWTGKYPFMLPKVCWGTDENWWHLKSCNCLKTIHGLSFVLSPNIPCNI